MSSTELFCVYLVQGATLLQLPRAERGPLFPRTHITEHRWHSASSKSLWSTYRRHHTDAPSGEPAEFLKIEVPSIARATKSTASSLDGFHKSQLSRWLPSGNGNNLIICSLDGVIFNFLYSRLDIVLPIHSNKRGNVCSVVFSHWKCSPLLSRIALKSVNCYEPGMLRISLNLRLVRRSSSRKCFDCFITSIIVPLNSKKANKA